MTVKDVETGVAAPGYLFGIPRRALCQLNDDKDLATLAARGNGEGLAQALGANLHTGLRNDGGDTPGSVAYQREIFGPNAFPKPPSKTLLSMILRNSKDPIIIMLFIAAVVSTVLGSALEQQRLENGWIEGVAIWLAIFVVIGVGATNDYTKEQQFRKMNALKEIFSVTVIRDGTEMVVETTEVVVGDLVVLDTGDKVSADGIMVLTHGLTIDEACLTGESDTIKKSVRDPWLRCGTQVTEGSGRMLVLAVGVDSEWGRTLALVTQASGGKTPLQEKLHWLAGLIAKVGCTAAVLLFVGLLARWLIVNKGFPTEKWNGNEEENGPIQFFLFCITLIVVAIPEGLPLAVTIALAYSVKCMMRDNNFVRVLDACETMGAITAICSDKTGTLTQNRMTVVEGWFAGVVHRTAPQHADLSPELITELQRNMALNSKAFIILPTEDSPALATSSITPLAAATKKGAKAPVVEAPMRSQQVQYVGNRTECALLSLMADWGGHYRELREDFQDDLVRVWGFSSEAKMSSCLLRLDAGRHRLYNKGAAEWVLAKCVSYQETSTAQGDGVTVQPMDGAKRQELLALVQGMAQRGLRCICLAYRDLQLLPSDLEGEAMAQAPSGQLVLQCIVGIKDPVRPEVPGAVAECQAAGIFVRMVTGDNIDTARFIAAECGIYTPGGLAMEGPAFRVLTDEQMMDVVPRLQVMARSSPEDKYRLVKFLRSQREVVAVTGDGTNDAPALKEADVGLAMGIAGTEVAKEAADIVLLDDNFSSIVKAIIWGRTVFSNIRKFLQFQLTTNIAALTICFFYSLISDEEPLNVIQLLWVNLVMNTMAALALATEKPSAEILKQKPNGRSEALITPTMWRYMAVNSAYQVGWMFIMLYVLPTLPRYTVTSKCDVFAQECPAIAAEAHLGLPAGSASTYCDYLAVGMRYSATPGSGQCNMREELDLAAVCAVTSSMITPCVEEVSVAELYEVVFARYIDVHNSQLTKTLSVVFNAFIFFQAFNEINSRRICDEYDIFNGLFTNPVFVTVMIVTVGMQVIIMNLLTSIFKVNSLIWQEWLFTIAIGFAIIPLSLANRFLYRTFWAPRAARRAGKAAAAEGVSPSAASACSSHQDAVTVEVLLELDQGALRRRGSQPHPEAGGDLGQHTPEGSAHASQAALATRDSGHV